MNEEDSYTDSITEEPLNSLQSESGIQSSRRRKKVLQVFFSLAYSMKNSLSHPFLLDAFVLVLTHLRLILWPLFIVPQSKYWEPTNLSLFFHTFCGALSDPLTFTNDTAILTSMVSTGIGLIIVHSILLICGLFSKTFRAYRVVCSSLYCIMGIVEYSFLNFSLRLVSLAFDCEELTDLPCNDVARKFLIGFGSLSALLLILTSGYYAAISFDSQILSHSVFHRVPGIDMAFFWILQLVASVLWVYHKLFEDFSGLIQIYVLFVLYAGYAYIMNTGRYYYNSTVTKLVQLFSVYMLGSVLTVMTLMVLQLDAKVSVAYMWILMLILVTVWFCVARKDYLLAGNGSVTDSTHLRFFIYEYLSSKGYSRGTTMQLQGFVINHIKMCNDPLCPLAESVNNAGTEAIDDKGLERLQKAMLTRFLTYRFTKAAESDSFNSSVRLEKAQFTLEVLQNCQRAKEEMIKIKSKGIIQEMWKYTLMQMINDFDYTDKAGLLAEFKENYRSSENKRKKEAVLVQLRIFEEKLVETECTSADSCYRLWSYVTLPQPKLDMTENLIINAVDRYQAVAKMWKEIESYSFIPAVLRKMYAVYLRDVLGDQVQFDWQNEIANEVENRVEQDDDTLEQATFHVDSQSTPIIVASAEPFEAWKITKINMSACQLFGYEQIQLLGQHIEILLPKLYWESHRQATLRVSENDFKSTSLFGFGQHKNGYVIPMNIKVVKSVPIGEDAMLVAAFRVVRGVYKGYVLTDKNYTITNVSSNAEGMLGIPRGAVKSHRLDIRQMFPAIGSTFIENLVGTKIKHGEYLLTTGILKVKNMDVLGYYFCFTKEPKRLMARNELMLAPIPKHPQFNFGYDPELGRFTRNWSDNYKHTATGHASAFERSDLKTSKEEVSAFFIKLEEFTSKTDFSGFIAGKLIAIYNKLLPEDRIPLEKQFVQIFINTNASETKVKTFRLQNGIKREVPEIPYSQKYIQNIEEDAGKIRRNKSLSTNGEEHNIRLWMSNREILNDKIVHSYRMQPLLKLFFIILLVLNLTFVFIAVVKGVYDSNFGKNLNKYLDYTANAFSRPRDFIELLQYFNLMIVSNGGKLRNTGSKTKQELLAHTRTTLLKVLDNLYVNVNKMHKHRGEKLLPQTKKRLEEKSISFILENGTTGKYDLITACHIYFSYIQKIAYIPIEEIIMEEFNTNFMYINRVPIFNGLSADARNFVDELFWCIFDYSSTLTWFIYIPSICSAVSVIVIIILIFLMQRSKVKILSAYLALSSRKLEAHCKTIERFSDFIKSCSKQELGTDSASHHERTNIQNVTLKQKPTKSRGSAHKKYEYSCWDTVNKIFKFCLIYILFESYFIGLYWAQNDWTERLMHFKEEYQITGQSATYFGTTLVGLVLTLDKTDNALWIRMTDGYYPMISNMLIDITRNHLLYGKKVSKQYDDMFRKLAEGNLCKVTYAEVNETFLTMEECEAALNGICAQGLFTVLTHFRAFLNYELRLYATLNESYAGTELYDEKCIERLNSEEAYYYYFIIPEVVKPAFNLLHKSLKDSLNSFIDTLMNIQTLALVAFLVAIICFQVLYGIAAYQENKRFKKIALAITITPPGLTVNNKDVVEYVKEIIGKSDN